jgi:hypothetical protein
VIFPSILSLASGERSQETSDDAMASLVTKKGAAKTAGKRTYSSVSGIFDCSSDSHTHLQIHVHPLPGCWDRLGRDHSRTGCSDRRKAVGLDPTDRPGCSLAADSGRMLAGCAADPLVRSPGDHAGSRLVAVDRRSPAAGIPRRTVAQVVRRSPAVAVGGRRSRTGRSRLAAGRILAGRSHPAGHRSRPGCIRRNPTLRLLQIC